MALAALEAFNTVVGVASLVLGAVGLAQPDPEQEEEDTLTVQITSLNNAMRALENDNRKILTRLDALTERDLATALVEVNVARDNLAEYRRTENPDDTLIRQIMRDSQVGLEQVMAQFVSIPAVIDDEVAATMAQAITYAVAVRFEAIELFDDRAIGVRAFRETLQEAATALEAINTSMLNWVDMRELTFRTDLSAVQAVTTWRVVDIGPDLREGGLASRYPGLADRFEALAVTRVFGRDSIELEVRRYFEARDGGIIDPRFDFGYYDRLTNNAMVSVMNALPSQRGTVVYDVVDENGAVIPEARQAFTEEGIGLFGVNIAVLARVGTVVETYRTDQRAELAASGLTDAAETFRGLADGVDRADQQGLSSELVGSAGNDLLSGLDGNDLLRGLADDDVLRGDSGNDTLQGGEGADVLLGDVGNDQLEGDAGNDSVLGGLGFDTLSGGTGNDTLNGGANTDRVNGGDGDDRLLGEAGFDNIYGDGGNDTLIGGTEADRLFGGTGDDQLFGGANFSLSADRLFGEAGNDTLLGSGGLDRLFGGAGDDLATGGTGRDGLFGEAGNDTLNGNEGDDRFFGGSGNDALNGGTGNDTLNGGSGFDRLNSGEGDDLIFGRFNADFFVFEDGHGNDTIADFTPLNRFENINLSDVSTINTLADLNLGSATGGAATQVGRNVVIDTGPGSSITLNNVLLSNLNADDFVF